MKKSNILILLVSLFIFSMGCSSDPEIDNPTQQTDPPWDKSRTARISFISNLAETGNYNSSNYSSVASSLKSDKSHIQILDNILVDTGSKNPGAIIASLAGKVPLFVSNSVDEKWYRGSTVCFDYTLNEMELISISDECRFVPVSFDIRPGLNVKLILGSMTSSSQIDKSTSQFKQALSSSALIVGIMPKAHFTDLEKKLTADLGVNNFILETLESESKNSDYCIYYFATPKWKFRNLTETKVYDNLKNFIIEMEYML